MMGQPREQVADQNAPLISCDQNKSYMTLKYNMEGQILHPYLV